MINIGLQPWIMCCCTWGAQPQNFFVHHQLMEVVKLVGWDVVGDAHAGQMEVVSRANARSPDARLPCTAAIDQDGIVANNWLWERASPQPSALTVDKHGSRS